MSQFSRHHDLEVGISQGWHHDGHISIHTTDDIVHIYRLINTHEEGLQTAVALHHRQELLALYVHEDASQSIARHRLDVGSLDRTIGLSRLLQGSVNGFIERESFSVNLQDTVLDVHLGSNHHLGRVGILRCTEGERSDELFRQSLSLSHHRHWRRDGLQALEQRRNGDALLLFSLEISYHLLLELSLCISHYRSHDEKRLVRKAHEP